VKSHSFGLGNAQNSFGLQTSCFKPLLKECLGLGLALLFGLGNHSPGLFAGSLETGLGLLSGCLKPVFQDRFLVVDSLQG
jgi:hypothetical protein